MDQETKDYIDKKFADLRKPPSDEEITAYRKMAYRMWAKWAIPGFIIAIISVIIIYKVLGIF